MQHLSRRHFCTSLDTALKTNHENTQLKLQSQLSLCLINRRDNWTEQTASILNSNMSELTDFDKGQIVGAHAAGLSVEEIAKLCDVSNEAVFEVLSMYNIPINNVSAEKNSEQRAKKRKRQKIADVNGRAASEKLTSETPVQTTATVTAVSDVNMQKQDSNQGGANDKPVLEIPDPETPVTETPDSAVNI